MDNQSLSNVLGILRLVRDANPNLTGIQMIQSWAGEKIPESGVLKVAAYVNEQAAEALTVIMNSQMPDEAKRGILEALSGVQKAFSLNQLSTQPLQHVKSVTSAVSNLVMILSIAQIDVEPQPPDEAKGLAEQVEELISQFDNGALDPVVREVAKQHLQTLATLLRHVHIFGLEAAWATYFELLAKLRRAEASSTPESKKESKPLSETIKSWANTFKSLDSICNAGGRMIGRAKTVGGLISYFSP